MRLMGGRRNWSGLSRISPSLPPKNGEWKRGGLEPRGASQPPDLSPPSHGGEEPRKNREKSKYGNWQVVSSVVCVWSVVSQPRGGTNS